MWRDNWGTLLLLPFFCCSWTFFVIILQAVIICRPLCCSITWMHNVHKCCNDHHVIENSSLRYNEDVSSCKLLKENLRFQTHDIKFKQNSYPEHQGTHAMAYHISLSEYGGISNSMEQQIPTKDWKLLKAS